MLGLPQAESDAFVDAYDRSFPEMKNLLQTAARLAEQRGYVKTYLGRRARFKDHKRMHKALNRVIQGTAADVMKTKIVELHNERKATGFLMRFTVHDEVDGDAQDEGSTARVETVLNRQSYEFKVPILWETGDGPNWAAAKS
jgi:DNA polymerase-1